ncbi:hypothetical protein [Aurantiacibacter luteus]|uniref:Uncharacterized protein n=1 Tax=Aurantiacibacter luteus TaxID=1581420 RepID=A0A0G9MUT2_9SPHN|nr:hypothetical protein [Aurantiacibacter luteus]KLE34465.1 hypothetical protein AAW00_09595 [Aurantiacibacter luteus]
MSGLIAARVGRHPGLAARLAERARKLAVAHAENALRTRRADPWRWRKARLLWPLIGGER